MANEWVTCEENRYNAITKERPASPAKLGGGEKNTESAILSIKFGTEENHHPLIRNELEFETQNLSFRQLKGGVDEASNLSGERPSNRHKHHGNKEMKVSMQFHFIEKGPIQRHFSP
jgi:hypothetical protein